MSGSNLNDTYLHELQRKIQTSTINSKILENQRVIQTNRVNLLKKKEEFVRNNLYNKVNQKFKSTIKKIDKVKNTIALKASNCILRKNVSIPYYYRQKIMIKFALKFVNQK